MSGMRRFTLWSLALLLASGVAFAEPDAATKEKARDLGLKGLTAYDNGEYPRAVELLEQAYRMYPAPTLGLYSARALAKMGRLTAASARYTAVVQMQLAKNASEQFKQAKADAETERAALIQRIPRLRVEVVGATGSPVVVIDGVSVNAQEVGTGVALNPGAHDVRASADGKETTMQVALQEGETKTVTLELTSSAPAPAPAPTPAPAATPPPTTSPPAPSATPPMTQPPPPAPAPKQGSGSRTAGWVLIGIGGVGLGVGAVTAVIANNKKSDLEGVCKPDISHCPESSRGVVDDYNNLRIASSAGFIGGGAGIAIGAILLATAPKSKENARRVTPWVGVGSVGMRGRF